MTGLLSGIGRRTGLKLIWSLETVLVRRETNIQRLAIMDIHIVVRFLVMDLQL